MLYKSTVMLAMLPSAAAFVVPSFAQPNHAVPASNIQMKLKMPVPQVAVPPTPEPEPSFLDGLGLPSVQLPDLSGVQLPDVADPTVLLTGVGVAGVAAVALLKLDEALSEPKTGNMGTAAISTWFG